MFRGKRLDRGSSTGLSVAHGALVGLDSSLPEQFSQLLWRLEPPISGQQFLPFQMGSPGLLVREIRLTA
jgi:hypothetical protein